MVDLFADVPKEMVENALQTIRRNLDQVGLYGGVVLHTDFDQYLMEVVVKAQEKAA